MLVIPTTIFSRSSTSMSRSHQADRPGSSGGQRERQTVTASQHAQNGKTDGIPAWSHRAALACSHHWPDARGPSRPPDRLTPHSPLLQTHLADTHRRRTMFPRGSLASPSCPWNLVGRWRWPPQRRCPTIYLVSMIWLDGRFEVFFLSPQMESDIRSPGLLSGFLFLLRAGAVLPPFPF